jgi:hypothetical protein
MQSLSRNPPILENQEDDPITTYGLTEDSEDFINYKFSKTEAQDPKPGDRIYLNGEKSEGLYISAYDGHWYQVVFNGYTPKPSRTVAAIGIRQPANNEADENDQIVIRDYGYPEDQEDDPYAASQQINQS